MKQENIFDGYAFAAKKEQALKQQLAALKRLATRERSTGEQPQTGRPFPTEQPPKIAAVFFTEDPASQLYSQLKQEAALRVGIAYELHRFSLKDDPAMVQAKIKQLNNDPSITGIIIQKPSKRVWHENQSATGDNAFQAWWQALVTTIKLSKDVDGLHPQTLAAIKNNNWQEQGKVLPATCQAVLLIIEQAAQKLQRDFTQGKIIIIGRSDILGKPLYYELKNKGSQVEMIGRQELEARIADKRYLQDADLVVSATGVQHLINEQMVKDGVVLIDVGEPKPDLDFAKLSQKASFITPVPGGVGPVTIVCLLENCLKLVNSSVPPVVYYPRY